jgi:UDP-glucose:(heptosyl)LPS alpha-1,3-glucosyltransferase
LSIENKLFNNTPVIIANSNMVRQNIMEHYKINGDKIRVLYNGVDLNRFNLRERPRLASEFRGEFDVKGDTAIVLFVGSGFERKGLYTLIAALDRVKTPVVLYVAGRGRTRRYEALARRLNVREKVVFAGPRGDIEKFYAAADVFVLPTLYDPFSNAALEAMAAGCAVITSKNNGLTEIIEDARDGVILEDMTNPEELADKIDGAIQRRGELGQMAAEKAKAFSIGRAAGEFASLIDGYCVGK